MLNYLQESLRSSERGLKCVGSLFDYIRDPVAPFVGAWIEISSDGITSTRSPVAPFVGAWIEIKIGLAFIMIHICVAPFVGAWIEMPKVSHVEV